MSGNQLKDSWHPSSKKVKNWCNAGTEQQREDMLELINQRINVLHSMGKSSEEFLELITCINESFPELYQQQKKTIFLNILSKLKNIFSKITTHSEY